MKKLLPVLMLCVLMISACKKDDNFTCALVCQNGGTVTDDCTCLCPTGFQGETCGNDVRPECVRENEGSVLFSNNTNDDFNIYVGGSYQGWIGEYSTFTLTGVPVGSYNVRYEQTDYIFSPDVYYDIVNIEQCVTTLEYI